VLALVSDGLIIIAPLSSSEFSNARHYQDRHLPTSSSLLFDGRQTPNKVVFLVGAQFLRTMLMTARYDQKVLSRISESNPFLTQNKVQSAFNHPPNHTLVINTLIIRDRTFIQYT